MEKRQTIRSHSSPPPPLTKIKINQLSFPSNFDCLLVLLVLQAHEGENFNRGFLSKIFRESYGEEIVLPKEVLQRSIQKLLYDDHVIFFKETLIFRLTDKGQKKIKESAALKFVAKQFIKNL